MFLLHSHPLYPDTIQQSLGSGFLLSDKNLMVAQKLKKRSLVHLNGQVDAESAEYKREY